MGKFLRDTWVLLLYHMRSSVASFVWLIVGIFQPVCYLFLFAPLLDSLQQVPGFPGGGTYNVFAPGLVVMTAILSTGLVGFGLLQSLQEGVIERWRVTPVSRLALILSLVLRDVLILLVQSAILFGAAAWLGMKADPAGLLLLLPLLALIGMSMSALSYTLTLILRDGGVLASTTNFMIVPLLLLSGITLPLTLAPLVLQDIGKWNPFAYAVDAGRALVNGNTGDSSVAIAYAVFVVLTALMLLWATRTIRKATA